MLFSWFTTHGPRPSESVRDEDERPTPGDRDSHIRCTVPVP